MVFGYPKHSFVQDDSLPDVKLLLAGLYFMTVTCLLVSSADNLCKQFGPGSGHSDGIPVGKELMTLVKVFRIIPEYRILRLTFQESRPQNAELSSL